MNRENRGNKPFIAIYLRQRWPALLLLLMATGVFALVLALHQVPATPALYAGEICLVLLVIWGIWDALRLRRQHRNLHSLLTALPASLTHLPQPKSSLEADYQALLAQLAWQYQQAGNQEQARYQGLQAFTANFGHQIKTPIAASRLLLAHVDSARRSLLLDELYKIERQVDMALNYFKLDARLDDYLFAPHSLKEIAAEAARRHARLFVLKHLSLSIDIPEEAVVSTDKKQLGFVLDQLLSNAIKYTHEGGVSISWEAANQRLSVTDTGIGIPSSDLPRVCEQGFTGVNGHLDHKATGMGLYLASEACHRMDIALDITSTVGQGTTVRLAFGRQQAPLD